ncbi:winged helix DNA-binding domain-containing protein [Catellatospora tritici]|uniref:winged helix DNA-binding domain-containing protein n=1 Tax=Catellatospora tritici TaxID=2851566 RepID=UPI001C2D90CA|nr:winged helix DNA-binding domain-containing protein [Catellatospora tritici]MBV1855153.1 winged helix DNA-binding domain-containing protein [Catellatospora tritici]
MLTRRDLNRALLARQLLLERSPLGPLEAIERLVGLPAQAPNPPYVGLWTRLREFQVEDLSGLLTSRAAVRTPLMRATPHLVSARDAMDIRPFLQVVQERSLSDPLRERLRGADPGQVVEAGRALVEQRPYTVKELGAALAAQWPEADPAALGAAARAGVALVQVPPHGLWGAVGQPAYTSAEHWLGAGDGPRMSLDDLVVRYFAAFGPATVRDVQAWSGLGGLREVVERLGDRLVDYRSEDGSELLDVPDAPLPHPDTPAPGRYLADFDATLSAYDDSTRIMDDRDRRDVFAVPGVVPGTVLVDGFVRAIWTIDRKKGAATLVVRPLFQIPTRDVQELTEEGERLLAFAAPDATRRDVRFNSRW